MEIDKEVLAVVSEEYGQAIYDFDVEVVQRDIIRLTVKFDTHDWSTKVYKYNVELGIFEGEPITIQADSASDLFDKVKTWYKDNCNINVLSYQKVESRCKQSKNEAYINYDAIAKECRIEALKLFIDKYLHALPERNEVIPQRGMNQTVFLLMELNPRSKELSKEVQDILDSYDTYESVDELTDSEIWSAIDYIDGSIVSDQFDRWCDKHPDATDREIVQVFMNMEEKFIKL